MIIYYCFCAILLTGLYLMIASDNLIRKVVGLAIFQAAILVFFIAIAKLNSGMVPILDPNLTEIDVKSFTSPLSHVLMLTAIVVGFATLSVALALVVRINKYFGTISESEITLKIKDDV